MKQMKPEEVLAGHFAPGEKVIYTLECRKGPSVAELTSFIPLFFVAAGMAALCALVFSFSIWVFNVMFSVLALIAIFMMWFQTISSVYEIEKWFIRFTLVFTDKAIYAAYGKNFSAVQSVYYSDVTLLNVGKRGLDIRTPEITLVSRSKSYGRARRQLRSQIFARVTRSEPELKIITMPFLPVWSGGRYAKILYCERFFKVRPEDVAPLTDAVTKIKADNPIYRSDLDKDPFTGRNWRYRP